MLFKIFSAFQKSNALLNSKRDALLDLERAPELSTVDIQFTDFPFSVFDLLFSASLFPPWNTHAQPQRFK